MTELGDQNPGKSPYDLRTVTGAATVAGIAVGVVLTPIFVPAVLDAFGFGSAGVVAATGGGTAAAGTVVADKVSGGQATARTTKSLREGTSTISAAAAGATGRLWGAAISARTTATASVVGQGVIGSFQAAADTATESLKVTTAFAFATKILNGAATSVTERLNLAAPVVGAVAVNGTREIWRRGGNIFGIRPRL
ncbi:hypothetical protein M422DRAFT_45176 [Sphaerobolus stellatus SS14]|nr:hypothetical protein M422DRAFT_45176 [Sphaerobolus stellatus SS14]